MDQSYQSPVTTAEGEPQPNKLPSVFIIVLNWNGLEDTIECLESMKKVTYPNYRVVVVDNGSSGNDVEVLTRRYGDYIHVIANDKNYGFPEGNNIGMRYAMERGADYIMLINNDTIVDPGFLSELVQVAESDPDIGMAGSKVYYYYFPDRIQQAGSKVIWWLGYIHPYSVRRDHGEQDGVVLERDLIAANSVIMPRRLVEKIGLLDAYFFYGIEELDYCLRAKRAGFRLVYVPKSRLWHKCGAGRDMLAEHPETARIIRSKGGFLCYKYSYYFFRKHFPAPWFVVPFLFFTLFEATFLIPAVRVLGRVIFLRDFGVVRLSLRVIGNLSTPWLRLSKRRHKRPAQQPSPAAQCSQLDPGNKPR